MKEIDRTFVTETLKKLVSINSINPKLSSQGNGEIEIAHYIDHILRGLGIDSDINEFEQGRANVTAVIRGKSSLKSIMLNAHMDTVGVEGMQEPFSGSIKNGKLYGRGAFDMKGSIAAILGVAKSISDNELMPNHDLILSFVADEEYESAGAIELLKTTKTTAAIVTEPTNLNICTAHRGFAIFNLETRGKKAHGGNHTIGIDANMQMGLILSELYKLSQKLEQDQGHLLCGSGSLHIPVIQGGDSLFIYSDSCNCSIEQRILPGETVESVRAQIDVIIEKVNEEFAGYTPTLTTKIWRNAYEIDKNCEIVRNLFQHSKNRLGKTPDLIGHTWWEDSALFGENGIETVIFGPIGGGIHEKVEWVELDSVIKLTEILCDVSLSY